MIIKKKYTQINNKTENIENTKAPEISKEASKEEHKIIEQENVDAVLEPSQTKKKEKKIDEFDLSIDDIKFEQRSERREGTRRRGYRRTEDRNVVSRAQKDAQSIKTAAKQDGYKEGINAAKEDIKLLHDKLEEFYNYKEVVFNKVSECIYDISVEIAKKIINKEIEKDSSAFISLVKSAVQEVNKTEEKITFRVMPKDVEILKDKIPEVFEGEYFDAKVSVIPDSNIKDGGVIVETSNGIIDATLETQLAIIEKALKTKSDDSESES